MRALLRHPAAKAGMVALLVWSGLGFAAYAPMFAALPSVYRASVESPEAKAAQQRMMDALTPVFVEIMRREAAHG